MLLFLQLRKTSALEKSLDVLEEKRQRLLEQDRERMERMAAREQQKRLEEMRRIEREQYGPANLIRIVANM